MWPFRPSPDAALIAEILAPGALPSAREKALAALMELPQGPKSVACFLQVALDRTQVGKTRAKAMQGLQRSPNILGARALLRCLTTDMRSSALALLTQPGFPDVLRGLGVESTQAFTAVLGQMTVEEGTRKAEFLLREHRELRELLTRIDTPQAAAILAAADAAAARLRQQLIPQFLERALTSRFHHEVKAALEELEKLATPEARRAIAIFRQGPSRLVEKLAAPGVGARSQDEKHQVSTREFGQQEGAEQRAVAGPAPAPGTPEPAAPQALDPEADPGGLLAHYYAAASSRGIEPDLLALVADQLPFLQDLHRHGSPAPLAATMDLRGKVNAFALTTPAEEKPVVDQGPEWAIAGFIAELQTSARQGTLLAGAVFFHGCHGPGKGARQVGVAHYAGDADCLVALLHHRDGQAVAWVSQYRRTAAGAWAYAPPYWVPIRRDVFASPEPRPHFATVPRDHGFVRRPIKAGDHGVHPELMTLLEERRELVMATRTNDSHAPVAVWLEPSGRIRAGLLVTRTTFTERTPNLDPDLGLVLYEDQQAGRTPQAALGYFVDRLRASAERGEIVASALFFHAMYDPQLAPQGLLPATAAERPDCLVVQLDHPLSQAMSAVIRYTPGPDGAWEYAPAEFHAHFPLIFNESGGSYQAYLKVRLSEVLRTAAATDADHDDYFAPRLRSLVQPETRLDGAFLRELLATMTVGQQTNLLDRLTLLGRVEVIPLVGALLETAPEPEKSRLAEILIRSGNVAG